MRILWSNIVMRHISSLIYRLFSLNISTVWIVASVWRKRRQSNLFLWQCIAATGHNSWSERSELNSIILRLHTSFILPTQCDIAESTMTRLSSEEYGEVYSTCVWIVSFRKLEFSPISKFFVPEFLCVSFQMQNNPFTSLHTDHARCKWSKCTHCAIDI